MSRPGSGELGTAAKQFGSMGTTATRWFSNRPRITTSASAKKAVVVGVDVGERQVRPDLVE